MNVNFVTGSEELDKKFIKEAGERGIANIKGYGRRNEGKYITQCLLK